MSNAFLFVLKMSLSASIVASVIMLIRVCLRKAPKIFSYMLWFVVLFRMLCPFTIPIHINNLSEISNHPFEDKISIVHIETQPVDTVNDQIANYNDKYNESVTNASPFSDAVTINDNTLHDKKSDRIVILDVFSYIWLCGVICMTFYFIYSYITLTRKLQISMRIIGNIYESDIIGSAFVLGIFQPKIYIPMNMTERQKHYVILHERTHVIRGDYLFKLIFYFALSLHWFNPIVWLSYFLMCGDMEKSCDEAVIWRLSKHGCDPDEIMKEYGMTLIELAKRIELVASAFFANNNVKERIENIMRYKKKNSIRMIITFIICGLFMTACVTEPYESKLERPLQEETTMDINMIEFPVLLSSVNITIDRNSKIIKFHCGDVSALSKKDIQIINACENITEFWLIEPDNVDLHFLSSLKNIKILEIMDWQGTDLSDIAKINTLETLSFRSCNCITDFAELSICSKLKKLQINNCHDVNNVSIEGISKLSSLEELYILYAYNVYDISSIGTMSNLRSLVLEEIEHVESIQFISSLQALDELHLYNMYISDLGFITTLKKLKTLDLSYNYYRNGTMIYRISDITPIMELDQLEYLYLMDMDVNDITPLAKLTELKELILNNIHPNSLVPLYGLGKLQKCQITNSDCSEEELNRLQKQLSSNCEFVTIGEG